MQLLKGQNVDLSMHKKDAESVLMELATRLMEDSVRQLFFLCFRKFSNYIISRVVIN